MVTSPASSHAPSPGRLFREALACEKPLQIVGAINAYTAILAQSVGFKALYLSGGGVAVNSIGVPDLGITTMDDVLTDIRRITDACPLPLLVDADTGWGSAFNIGRTVRSFEKQGAAGLHLEDQISAKRCGHRPNKSIVPVQEMVDRIKAAVDARTDHQFVIMARTDAAASEGLEGAIERATAYIQAGADMIFPEALTALDQYSQFKSKVQVPVLANITEFGQTPLFDLEALRTANVDMALYCCAAYRTMNAAALNAYHTIRSTGTQRSLLPYMQSRSELYAKLNYASYEAKLDALFQPHHKDPP